jgi:hypothetical protein
MANGRYEVMGLVPASSDFTLDRAVQHYSSLTFTQYLRGQPVFVNEPVRAEVVSQDTAAFSTGFRVWYGPWAVVAWLDSGPEVAEDNRYLAEEPGLPAPPEVIAGCPYRLSVYSDYDDPDFNNSDRFTEFTDELMERFGMFIQDYVRGGWWTLSRRTKRST